MTDLYKVLQVDPAADQEVVEAAYRRLARKFHPDVSRLADAGRLIRELNRAYEVLGDPTRRAAYDRELREPPPRRRRIRVVRPTPPPPRPRSRAEPAPAVGPPLRLGRPAVAATLAGLAASVAVAALSAQLFTAARFGDDGAPAGSIVLVMTQYEPPATPEARATAAPTPAEVPASPVYVLVPAPSASGAPTTDLLAWFRRAASAAHRRIAGPLPPEPPSRPYNPSVP